MSYSLGVDLGTSYTAAATARGDRVEIANLGNQSATIPSVVLLKEDHTILTGEAANRRGVTEPDRVAREFKRRVGDTTPLFLGGAPQSAESLMARLLRWVADEVAAREGGPADRLAVCHPANWGQYKQDLLSQAVRIAELGTATFITEPEAAAIHYASNERIDPGEIVAVYDLGGGTFDAAVLRRTNTGFEILGEPEGIERLGGIDFDAAVFAHVARSLGGKLEELDEDDPTAIAAVARLRNECIEAKEALSSDTDVSIQVLLPNIQTDVRLTRNEFEAMIRPSLTDTIGAMRRALTSAGVEASDLKTVLLAGGSSRIPLISQIVGAELGRPVAVDAHPKHAVALGAAIAAATGDQAAGAAVPPPVAPPASPPAEAPQRSDPDDTIVIPPVVAAAAAAASAGDAAAADRTAAVGDAAATVESAATTGSPAGASAAGGASVGRADRPPAGARSSVRPASTPAGPPPETPLLVEHESKSNRGKIIAAVVILVLALGGIGAAVALTGGDDDGDTATVTTVLDGATTVAETVAPETTAGEVVPDESATTVAAETTVAPETTVEVATTAEVAATTTEVVLAPPDPVAVIEDIEAIASATFSEITISFPSDRSVVLGGRAFDEASRQSILAAANVPGMDEVVDQMALQSADEQCTEIVRSFESWACLRAVTWDGTTLAAFYHGTPDFGGPAWDVASNHLHIFGNNVPVVGAGTPGPFSDGTGAWIVWDDPSLFTGVPADIGSPDGVPEKVCVRIADATHTLLSLDNGNCWPVEIFE